MTRGSDDADALFSKHSIGEIRDLHVKIRAEADRKKSDLRLMVGERYRDVIDAAEAIRIMKSCAEKMIGSFKEIKHICNCDYLHHRVLQETKKVADTQLENQRKTLYPIASQIRVLVLTPDRIWKCLERQAYLEASQLHHISRMIHVSLSSAPRPFGMIQQQWDAIVPLKAQIVERATLTLSSYDSDANLLSSLLGLILLENMPLDASLTLFLTSRHQSIRELATHLQSHPECLADSLFQFVTIISSTLSSIQALVFDKDTYDLQQALQNTQLQGESLVKSLYSGKEDLSISFRHLPPSILGYRPRLAPAVEKNMILDSDSIKEQCSDWVASVIQSISSQLPTILDQLDDGESFGRCATDFLYRLSYFDSSSQGMQLIGKSSFSFWQDVFKPAFVQRGYQLVDDTFKSLLVDPIAALDHAMGQLTESKVDRQMGQHIWTSSSQEHPWFSSLVQSVFHEFESTCLKIQSDISPLVLDIVKTPPSPSRRSSLLKLTVSTIEPTSLSKGAPEIHSYIEIAFTKALGAFQTRLLQKMESGDPLKLDQALFVGKCARRIAFGLPGIESSFAHLHSPHLIEKKVGRWTPVESSLTLCQSVLMEVYVCAYSHWTRASLDVYCSELERCLKSASWNHSDVCALWQSVKVDGSDDEPLKMPIYPSSFLNDVLFRLSLELDRIGGFVIEKPIIADLVCLLLRRSFETYSLIVNSVDEKGAMQVLFDLLYIERLCEGGSTPFAYQRELPITKGDVESLLASIKAKIDPIDLTVIESTLSLNVDRHYLKTFTLFASLTILNSLPRDLKWNAAQEQPSLVHTAPSCPRFPLLPISGGPTRSNQVEKVKIVKPLPPIMIRLTRGQESVDRDSSGLPSVMGLVNAVTGISVAQQSKANELFSYISGVWGSSTLRK